MSALAGQYKSKFLTRLVNANIDIANIRSFVRIKRIGKDLRFLKEVLADGGSIAVPRYLELFPKTFDDFFEMLDGTPYGPPSPAPMTPSKPRNALRVREAVRQLHGRGAQGVPLYPVRH